MTFDEIFWEMFKKLEEANKRVEELEIENELQRYTIEDLERRLRAKSKSDKKK